MKAAPIPEDEEQRLSILREYAILDTPPEAAFDGLAQLAAHICQTPMAVVSFIDSDRQWFKAHVDMPTTQTSRETAFCAYAILDKNRLMQVPDALLDERFVGNPSVTGGPQIRFYAGAPLVAKDDQPLGTLCVLDREPRTLSLAQAAALQSLSRSVVAHLELRRHARLLAEEMAVKEKLLENLRQQNAQLLRSEQETQRLLELGDKSRLSLMKVLEDEQRLARELRRWADAFENCAQAILIGTPADGTVYAGNRALAELHGRPKEEIAGLPLLSLCPERYHFQILESFQMADRDGHVLFEVPMLKADGSTFDASVDIVSVRELGTEPLYWVVTIQDITAQKKNDLLLARTNRALQMMSACNEALVRASDEAELLSEVCRLAVETGGYRLAWVGYAWHDEKCTIQPVAHAGHDDGYLSEISLSWSVDAPSGQGPAARCIRNGKTVICDDITLKSAGFFWTEAALRRGYRSIVCLPLKNDKHTFGVLALYGSDVQDISDDEIRLLKEMADDLAFGIRHIRNLHERHRMQDVVLKVSQAVSAGQGEDFFQSLTRHLVEALEADGGMIGRLDEARRHEVCTQVLYMDRQFHDQICYELVSTPCEGVSLGYTSVYEHSLQQQFPDDCWLRNNGIEAYAGLPLMDRNHKVSGILSVFFRRPITHASLVHSTLKIFAARVAEELERRKTDERLREQASLLDKAQDAILVRDLEHRITYWNKSAENLYGWTAEEVLGEVVTNLFYKDVGFFDQAMTQLTEEGEWVGELEQVTKDGNQLMVGCRWTLVRDAAGQPKSVLCINTDITEQKKLEQQFLRAQRMESIGTLAGGIAHDLNNVLAPIMMAIDLLKMTVKDTNGLEILNTISQSAQRGAEMVNQVLSFARGMEGRRMDVYAHMLVRDIEKIARDTFPKNIQITCHYHEGLWPVIGDPTQLHQVLLNLCVNARDAMPEGGRLTVTGSNEKLDESYAAMNLDASPGPYLKLEVSDSGSGIPPAIIEQIFDPFFTTKELGKGTGLGLSTSLAIIKSHGGFIRVQSQPGRGSIFTIYLPARETSSQFAAAPAQQELPHGCGETILVVDDEQTIREITQQTLQTFGYKVLVAADGAEAVTIYAQYRDSIALVLTDMMMPVMDGPATIKVLLNMNPELKIIAASGIATNEAVARASAMGVRNFVGKPYTAESLLKVLHACLTDS